jgi:hypothetical protein
MLLSVLRLPQALLLAFSCVAFAWSIHVLPRSEHIDQLAYLKDQLLRSEIYEPESTKRLYEELQNAYLGECEPDSQMSLILMSLRVAENALRTGAATDFDLKLDDLTTSIRVALGCAPRSSYLWLLSFWTETLSGRLGPKSLEMLAMSYETGPNEGWIAIRRNSTAIPVVPIASDPLRQRIIREFGLLVRDGFLREAAASYSVATPEVRSALQTELLRSGDSRQREFWQAVQARNPRLAPPQENN